MHINITLDSVLAANLAGDLAKAVAHSETRSVTLAVRLSDWDDGVVLEPRFQLSGDKSRMIGFGVPGEYKVGR